MRRISALLVAILLLGSAGALAAPATPYDPGLMLYYPDFSPEKQALFDLIYEGVTDGKAKIDLPDGTRYDDLTQVMQAIQTDCPELLGLGGSYSAGYYQDHPEIALSLTPSYEMDAQAAQELSDAMIQAARSVAAEASGDDFAREVYLHDRLCAGTAYDLSGTGAYSVMGPLQYGRGACEGYAETMALLCRLAGLRCGVVSGFADDGAGSQSHAWNIVYLDGSPTQLDVTWDDQDAMGYTTRWYLNLTDAQMAADHQADTVLPLPACTAENNNWHVRAGLMASDNAVTTELLLTRELERLLRGESAAVDLRFPSATAYQTFVASLDSMLDAFNASRPDGDGFYGSYSVSRSDRQLCFLLMRE